ncbi:hypothetical protein TrLO_g12132 [Triparma laevis f. longispina]|uniref:EF-hand domain-containing protein n=1 Tax=Triparma laevis f. longispina TaxID=1714387 RepID=A0A9W7KZF1_9STRA|nr:hypothetical protein TrLO_g12132 [Triparma laevis f. longispina]
MHSPDHDGEEKYDEGSRTSPLLKGGADEDGRGTFSLTGVGLEEGMKILNDKRDDDEGFDLDDRFIAEIMMSLNNEKIATLRKAFEQNDDDGLSLAEFVHVMTSILDMGHLMTADQFAANLIEFFDQVDINGDGAMEWDEFTSFIVEMGMNEHDHQPDAISNYFFTATKETGNHNAYVQDIRYHKNDTVTMFDFDSKQVRIYNSKMDLVHTIISNSGQVQCCEFLASPNLYAISTNDLSVNFYDGHSYQVVKKFRTPNQNTTVIRWIESEKLLFTGDTRGSIKAWDCQDMEEKFEMGMRDAYSAAGGLLSRRALGLHRDIILDIIELEGLEVVASASIDRTIKLWDLPTGKLRRTLVGHKKGIRKITYSSEYRFLISVGFDFDVLVWNPYVANLILRLSDHGCSLCGAEIIPNTPILVTADVEGSFKVWDVRNWKMNQTFKAEEKRSGQLKGFCALASTKSIVAVGRDMHVFDYEKIEMPEFSDEFPLCSALYNPTTSTFITCSNKFVKIWDAGEGKIMKVYRNLSDSDITAMCLDFRERKFILGDHDGSLHCYDFLNGADMKEFAYEEMDGKAHLDEITKLLYCDEHATVISTGWDKTVSIHSESEADEGVLLRRIENAHNTDITALSHSHTLSLIATGSADSRLKVWDYEFCRMEASLNEHNSPITCVQFLDPFPALMSCDAGGNVILWAVRPSKVKNRIMARWKNRPANKRAGGKPQAAAITVITVACKFAGETRGRKGTSFDEAEGEGEAEAEDDFVDKHMGSSEEAQRWIERLKRLTKNRAKKRGKKDQEEVEEFLIYAGDERGNVVVWDLLPTMEGLMKEYGGTPQGMGPLEGPLECGNPRRHIVYDAGADRLAKLWKMNGTVLGVLRQGGPKRGETWEFGLDTRAIGVKKLEDGGKIMDEVREMEALELDSSGEEDDMSSTLTMMSYDPLAAGGGMAGLARAEREQESVSYRKTPKRIPINPATVGRRRKRK